jgi:hypothetical protein
MQTLAIEPTAPTIRPKTRGELVERLHAGETCEVVADNAEITDLMIRGWLNPPSYTIIPSLNPSWALFRPVVKSAPRFWLHGWHRLWHRYEVQGSTSPVTDADRLARSKIAKRFTLAEWRFHYSLPSLKKQ